MRNRKIGMLLILLCAGTAQAGFVVTPKPRSMLAGGCVSASFVETGAADAPRPLIAAATSEAVMSSIRRVVPHGWKIVGDLAVADNHLVSWQSSGPWFKTLAQLAVNGNLCIAVNHAEQTIWIAAAHPLPPVPLPALVPTTVHSPSVPLPDAVASAVADPERDAEPSLPNVLVEVPVAMEAPAAIPEWPYQLRGGDTVRQTLAMWCDHEGWQLVWQSEYDYPIEAAYQFPAGTTFKDAVRAVLKSYWNRAKPLTGRAYTNRVLIVGGRN